MKQRTVLRIVALAAILAAIILIAWELPAKQWIESFIAWIRGLGASGAFLYGMVYAAGAIAMLPGSALTAGAGLVYGTLIGVLIVSPASVVQPPHHFSLPATLPGIGWNESSVPIPSLQPLTVPLKNRGSKLFC
jgi:hypothetical protein